jgi:hypothetical protein
VRRRLARALSTIITLAALTARQAQPLLLPLLLQQPLCSAPVRSVAAAALLAGLGLLQLQHLCSRARTATQRAAWRA